ncbi:unnamed protein product, partial [Clonostachys solani]
TSSTMPSRTEVAKHNTKDSCWVVISGIVYDVTQLIDQHPGGANAILALAGKDATEDFDLFHSSSTIKSRPGQVIEIGPLAAGDGSSQPPPSPLASFLAPDTPDSRETSLKMSTKLPLVACRSLQDFENTALQLLPERSRVYFNSGSETRSAFDNNRSDWARLTFRPRVLRDASKVSMREQIMGVHSTLPIFIAPTASAQLGNPDGELCFTRAAARMGIPQGLSTYASKSPKEVAECFQNEPQRRGGALFYQLYVPKTKGNAEPMLAEAKSLGYKALLLTVDNPVLGKRDDNDQYKELAALGPDDENRPYATPPLPGEEPGVPRAIHDPTLSWDDLPWIRKAWGDRPLILKGIQCVEDAVEALRHGVDGIYISNHGGRQLDYAPSAVEVLLEIRQNAPHVFEKIDVYVDGGIMRGTDVVKAICLGAKAVGIGRGFLYALCAHGTDGVVRAIEIMSEEIQTTMRLLGVTDLSQLNPSFLNFSRFSQAKDINTFSSKL